MHSACFGHVRIGEENRFEAGIDSSGDSESVQKNRCFQK